MCMHVSIPSFAVFCNTLWILLFQVLAYAQQSRERSNYEQAALVERMQEFKRQIDRESRWSPNGINDSPNGDGIQAIGRFTKMIERYDQLKACTFCCPGIILCLCLHSEYLFQISRHYRQRLSLKAIFKLER